MSTLREKVYEAVFEENASLKQEKLKALLVSLNNEGYVGRSIYPQSLARRF
jgi:hypothetical protein